MSSTLAAALEHLDDEEYEEAVAALTQALGEAEGDAATQAKVFEKRAAARLALGRLEEAADDAAAALDARPMQPSQGAFLCKGEALFRLDEYESARAAFERGKAVKGPAGKKAAVFDRWMRKCDAELADEEDESGVELSDVSVVEGEVKERRSSSSFSVKNPMARKPREHSIAQQHPPTEIQNGSDDDENIFEQKSLQNVDNLI